jgi:hypothetical protein
MISVIMDLSVFLDAASKRNALIQCNVMINVKQISIVYKMEVVAVMISVHNKLSV